MATDPHFIIDDDYDPEDPDEECGNCGGEGYVASCFEEFACLHPEDGCDLCMRRCDWCNPALSKATPS